MVDWTDDRITALSDQDLKNLLTNAERRSVSEVVEKCRAELDKRNAAKPRKASKPRSELKEFEHDMSAQLAEIGKEVAGKYDLSEETAKAKSEGVKGFKAHRLLDSKGYAKLGGMQRTARSPSSATFPIAAVTAPPISESFCRRTRRRKIMNSM